MWLFWLKSAGTSCSGTRIRPEQYADIWAIEHWKNVGIFLEEVTALMEFDWKILIVDDDAGIRRMMKIALEQAGYDVVTVPDGHRGIRLCREESPADCDNRYRYARH